MLQNPHPAVLSPARESAPRPTPSLETANGPPEISVVVPLYNEEENVGELYRRLVCSLEELDLPFELVFVNDGSKDATPRLLDDLQAGDRRVVAIHLSRNFGHQAAVSAGLDHAAGRAVIIMDGDLQDPPEVLGQFIRRWQEGAEVVYAVRTKRKENWFKRCGYFLFYRLLRAISDIDIPLDSGDFCLMDRKVIDVLNHLPERLRFVRGLRTFVGFKQVGLCYERAAREAGEPKYTFRALVRLAVDGLVSFSGYPLRLVTYFGFFSAALAIGLSVWAFVDAVSNQATPRGWASTIIVVLFMGAIQLLSLGIIGEYIRRIFLEAKGRPTYIVRDVRKDVAGWENVVMASDSVHNVPVTPPHGLATQALLVALVAGALASSAAWLEQRHPVAPLDLDGWGHLVTRLQTSGHFFGLLVQEPSLWKGPVVPFIFGVSYYLVPVPEAVLCLNVVAFACAAGCLYVGFRLLGSGGWEAAVPVLLWGAYPPHRYIFGYYYAEPLLALLSALLFFLAARLAVKPFRGLALAGGVLAGILVLARAPFLPVVVGLGSWLLLRGGKDYRVCSFLFFLGLLAAFVPWPLRNMMVEGTFVPFTTEGGKILFQGTYLPGDDQVMSELRRMPEFQQLEQGESDKSPVEQMR